MPDPLRANRNCPVKNTPALCFDCALAIRVLDDAGREELRKKGVKDVEALTWDCPLRMPALYLGELRDSIESVANQLAAIADVAEGIAKYFAIAKKSSKKGKKGKKSGPPSIGDGLED